MKEAEKDTQNHRETEPQKVPPKSNPQHKFQVSTMTDASEVVHYDVPGVPVYVRTSSLSHYVGRRAVCHWHDDLELISILSGEMNYYINGQTVLLKPGDTIIINTREMHYGYSNQNRDCDFICLLFLPTLLSACRALFEQHVTPFLNSRDFPFLLFSGALHPEIFQLMEKIAQKKEEQAPLYEFDLIGLLYSLWGFVSRFAGDSASGDYKELPPDVLALRKMVSFIHDHYREAITLQQIADAASICRSKCCSVFANQTGQSPFDFLNGYRLQLGADLLTGSTLPVTKIALECGFNHPSYFSKLFFRQYQCTPRQFRSQTPDL